MVSTLFKIVDSNGKVLKNFPVQTRPKGKNSFERNTDENGILNVESSPNRDIEVLVLNSKDLFVLKSSINSGNGSQQPITIQLDEPFEKFKSTGVINLYDRDSSHFIIKKTNVEIHFLETNKKKKFVISNGKINMISMIGQKMQLTVFKPDGKPLAPVIYLAKRVKEKPFSLNIDVDITSGSTDTNKPATEKKVKEDILITIEQMQKMWPGVGSNKMKPIMDELNSDLTGYKLDTRLRQAHFMAQVRQEVGPKFLLREQVEYMGAAALKKIGYYRTHPKDADIDGYKKENGPANGVVIANRMYDDKYRSAKFKLGNTSRGDGWKYLGRGLKQLTGKSNYKDLTDMYAIVWSGENVDFVKNPELLEKPKYAVRSAIRFWLKFKLYEIADKGATKTQVDSITSVINKATDSYEARQKHFSNTYNIFK